MKHPFILSLCLGYLGCGQFKEMSHIPFTLAQRKQEAFFLMSLENLQTSPLKLDVVFRLCINGEMLTAMAKAVTKVDVTGMFQRESERVRE